MKTNKFNRREFIKKSSAGAVGFSVAASAKSYANILGANDRMNFAAVGVHGRGKALILAASQQKNTSMSAICDVDERESDIAGKFVKDKFGKKPKFYTDIRKLLEDKDIDAILIATPDHWHAPMSLMGVQADKHVYVEKPCSHNPREGELLVEARQKYGKVIQMGNQQRSGLISIQAMKDIQEGLIGDVYYGKAWYANDRKSIGTGKAVEVPSWLDWELWQGPAPREEYKDNFVHYNWHWFTNWGTGEICNNGTHEIDICRWALGASYPKTVASSGGRFHFKDDWEFYDTQVANFEFDGGKMLSWEGRSCNGLRQYKRGRGATIHGTKGTILLDRNNYIAYDNDQNVIKEMAAKDISATTDTTGVGGLDVYHMSNFINAIKDGEKLHSPIEEGHISTLLCHLGNISQRVGRKLNLDASNGHILNDPEAMEHWGREYAPGWDMKV
ncbi:Gfo/Idh/MocA family oxidoreductase [Fulvivirgaceae bacterium BMA12]|uniref:Gfo/Idh/MocA family oxidoreductase n=1 Tax=Agaribacillus aureus TaxID=3051825 RepID=A0ABT8L858_9BACT|nr:Gfo/Idh/MocA family oxidoreductase [Fulvivirgaceae bacterium BMA12]